MANKSYKKGPVVEVGLAGPDGFLPSICAGDGGIYLVKSRCFTGKMTGVSDLSQNTPLAVVKRLR